MPRLESPGFEQIIRLVDIIAPVVLPVGGVMLPDLAITTGRQIDGKAPCHQVGAVKIAGLAGGFKGGDKRFDRMHVGVLPAIGGQGRKAGVTFVGIGLVIRFVELRLHEIPDVGNQPVGTGDAGLMRPGGGQHDKGMAIGHGAAIFDDIALALPQIMPGSGQMMGFEIAQPMRCPVAVMRPAGPQKGVRVIEDKAR